jgi:hypothetical protein
MSYDRPRFKMDTSSTPGPISRISFLSNPIIQGGISIFAAVAGAFAQKYFGFIAFIMPVTAIVLFAIGLRFCRYPRAVGHGSSVMQVTSIKTVIL